MIVLRRPLGEAVAALDRFPWDFDRDLVELTGRDVVRVLDFLFEASAPRHSTPSHPGR